MVRAIRGAITAENTADSITYNTKLMLEEIISVNKLEYPQIVSIIFTCTKDLDAAYPAVAAREMGILDASLMCVSEMDVAGSLRRCVRVQILAETDASQSEMRHVYLKEAAALRPDLKQS